VVSEHASQSKRTEKASVWMPFLVFCAPEDGGLREKEKIIKKSLTNRKTALCLWV